MEDQLGAGSWFVDSRIDLAECRQVGRFEALLYPVVDVGVWRRREEDVVEKIRCLVKHGRLIGQLDRGCAIVVLPSEITPAGRVASFLGRGNGHQSLAPQLTSNSICPKASMPSVKRE